MRKIARYFFQGVLVLVPIALTLYLVVYGVLWIDSGVNDLIEKIVDRRFPGVGVPLVLAVIFITGWLVQLWLFRKLWRLADWIFEKLPLVKSIYTAIRDTLAFLFGGQESFDTVVYLEIPGADMGVLGFVTNENPGEKTGLEMDDRVAVYIPMAFNVGGYTLYIPRDQLKPVKMSVEGAMAFVLSGGAGGRSQVERE